LNEAKQFSIALDTAKGMAYLVTVRILFSTHHCSAWFEHSPYPQRSQGKQTVYIVTTHTALPEPEHFGTASCFFP
jgi:hypothetical protein